MQKMNRGIRVKDGVYNDTTVWLVARIKYRYHN